MKLGLQRDQVAHIISGTGELLLLVQMDAEVALGHRLEPVIALDEEKSTTNHDDIPKVRRDVEELRQLVRDPVEAARITYEVLLDLRQNGKV